MTCFVPATSSNEAVVGKGAAGQVLGLVGARHLLPKLQHAHVHALSHTAAAGAGHKSAVTQRMQNPLLNHAEAATTEELLTCMGSAT